MFVHTLFSALRTSEEPQIKEKEKEFSLSREQLLEAKTQHEACMIQAKQAKQKFQELQEHIQERKTGIANTQRDCDKLRSQIVPSPEGLKRVYIVPPQFPCIV